MPIKGDGEIKWISSTPGKVFVGYVYNIIQGLEFYDYIDPGPALM